MSRSKVLQSLVSSVFVLGLIGIFIAARFGEHEGEEAKAKLQLIWPNLKDMPDQDRAFIASLAYTCGLHAQPAIKAGVVDCLKMAARDETGLLPVGVAPSEALEKLDRMLVAAGQNHP